MRVGVWDYCLWFLLLTGNYVTMQSYAVKSNIEFSRTSLVNFSEKRGHDFWERHFYWVFKMYVFGTFCLHYVHVENNFSTADISGKLTPKQSRCRPQKKCTCAFCLNWLFNCPTATVLSYLGPWRTPHLFHNSVHKMVLFLLAVKWFVLS